MTGKHARLRPRWIKAGLGALGGISLAGAVFLVPQHLPHVQPLAPAQSPATAPGGGTERLAQTSGPSPVFSSQSAVQRRILAHTPARITFATTPAPLLKPTVPPGIVLIKGTPAPVRTGPAPAPVTSPAHVPVPGVSATASPSLWPWPWPTLPSRHRHHHHPPVSCSATP